MMFEPIVPLDQQLGARLRTTTRVYMSLFTLDVACRRLKRNLVLRSSGYLAERSMAAETSDPFRLRLWGRPVASIVVVNRPHSRNCSTDALCKLAYYRDIVRHVLHGQTGWHTGRNPGPLLMYMYGFFGLAKNSQGSHPNTEGARKASLVSEALSFTLCRGEPRIHCRAMPRVSANELDVP
jgi:hypothetical protein